MRIAAHFLSWIFHPLLLTTWLILFLGYFFPPILGIKPEVLIKFAFFVMMVTFIFPALNVALMVRLSGTETPIAMPLRRQRLGPFVVISVIYCFFAGLFLYKEILGPNFNRITLIIASLVLVGTLITFFYKISIHSLGMAGFAGMLVGLNNLTNGILLYPTTVVVLLSGIVMSARLLLNAHSLREVLSGGIVGFVVGLGGIVLLFS